MVSLSDFLKRGKSQEAGKDEAEQTSSTPQKKVQLPPLQTDTRTQTSTPATITKEENPTRKMIEGAGTFAKGTYALGKGLLKGFSLT